MEKAGEYNLRKHSEEDKKNFPKDFSGEHPLSGSFIHYGFWGTKKAGF
jgi:hypothetical protein